MLEKQAKMYLDWCNATGCNPNELKSLRLYCLLYFKEETERLEMN